MKKIVVLLFFSILLISLTACVSHVEDTNGEDNYTIETFSDDDIVNSKISHISFGSMISRTNGKGNAHIKKFSGVYELENFKLDNEYLKIEVDSECFSGNFALVLIVDNQIIKIFENNSTETYEIEKANGNFRLRMVGESANIKVEYEISK